MRNRPRVTLALAVTLGLVATLALAGTVQAAETTLTATLAGVQEGDTPGDHDGSGSASIVIDPAAGTACWTLSAESINPVTQSHIHIGAEGESGDIVVPLDVDGFDRIQRGLHRADGGRGRAPGDRRQPGGLLRQPPYR